MDLGTIKSKCIKHEFKDGWEFADAMRLVWENAKTYNRPGSGIYLVAEQLQDMWERKFKQGEKRKITDINNTDCEAARVRFTELIKQLNSDQIGTIVDIIEKSCPKALHEEDYEEDLEIEVTDIDLKTLKQCNDYANECITNSAKRKKKAT